MRDQLTDKEYWEVYWENNIHNKEDFHDFFQNFKYEDYQENESVLEVGGYPGTKVSWLASKFGLEPLILDIVLDENVVRKVEESYGLQKNSIRTYKDDFFTFDSGEQYNYVMSHGFIEHFENLYDVLDRHFDMCTS